MAFRQAIPLFPLNTVLFPGMNLPLHIFEDRYRDMISFCVDRGSEFGVLLLRSGDEGGGGIVEPAEIGTLAKITEVTRLPDGRMNIMTQGTHRFRTVALNYEQSYMTGDIETLDDVPAETPSGTVGAARDRFEAYVRLLLALAGQWQRQIDLPGEAVDLSFSIASALKVETDQKQELLEEPRAEDRLAREANILDHENARLKKLVVHKWQNAGGTGYPVNV